MKTKASEANLTASEVRTAFVIFVNSVFGYLLQVIQCFYKWLVTPRDYFATEGGEPCEPITATGFQLIFYSICTILVGFLMSLQW